MKNWALVTGAARRIGKAIALELAAKGWNIVVHYHRSATEATATADEIRQLGVEVVLAEIDLANAAHVAKLIPSLVEALGSMTTLVNNASLFDRDSDDPDGSRHRAVNVIAPRLLSEALHRSLASDGQGVIVNLLDALPPEEGLDAYCASKRELERQTLELAKSFAPRLRVNGVASGPVLPSPRQSPRHFQAQIEKTFLKQPIAPEEIARAVGFLVSSPSITGEILHVNGGHV